MMFWVLRDHSNKIGITYITSQHLYDIDVIHFDTSDTTLEMEKQLENELRFLLPNQPWSVKNQARMHMKSDFNPFSSSLDGVAHFPEIPTAIAVRLYHKELEVMAPYGLQDLFEMKVRPTPFYQMNSRYYPIYIERMMKKNWDLIWEKLSIEI